jgi:hypothetical protein
MYRVTMKNSSWHNHYKPHSGFTNVKFCTTSFVVIKDIKI